MRIFDYQDSESFGVVQTVDTATVSVKVIDIEKLRRLQVNRLVALQSSKPGQHLIGIVQRISRSSSDNLIQDGKGIASIEKSENNTVRISLIGTFKDKEGVIDNIFRRTLETVPEIDGLCFSIEGEKLTSFMRVISAIQGDGHKLSLGHYTIDESAQAYIDGNRLFQRHAIVVGSTGSGKSWTTAKLIEQAAELKNVNAVVFDIHGEYSPLKHDGIKHFRIAGPADLGSGKGISDGIIYLPFWLLGYEAAVSLFVDRSDQNAPNQAMIMSRTIVEKKKEMLSQLDRQDLLDSFTVDSPIPFSISNLLSVLNDLNTEMIMGSGNREKQGDFHGKLSRMISRFEAKISDRRLGFMFQGTDETNTLEWLSKIALTLFGGRLHQSQEQGGIKVIDFSEVPSDVLPLIVSLVARLAFSIQQWTLSSERHPIALFCDEAHLYIPEGPGKSGADDISVGIFERVAKEGRKYGVGLVVISQRPSEVNRTVLSQCNNLIAMRLTNAEDQNVVRRLLPDSLGGFGELLPILDTGEAIIVGDACLLPSRVRIERPVLTPNSATVAFWDKWSGSEKNGDIDKAVLAWQKQSLQ